MSEEERETATLRVVVSFDATPLGEAALEAAMGLAEALDAEIAGLFVENVELMRMAELPFTRELGLTSAVLRPIEAPDIERALRVQAERSREWLAAAASALNLRWSFQVVRGQSLNAVLEWVQAPDMIVFGGAAVWATARSAEPAARAAGAAKGSRAQRFRHLGLHPVVTLFDGSARASRSLAAAHALAVAAGTRLTLLVAAATPEEFDRLRQEAKSWLVERHAAARFIWLKSRDVEDVVRTVSAERPAALVWHDEASPEDRRALRNLLAALHCPLVLVS